MVSSETFDNATAFFPSSRPPPKRMMPQPSLPISQPVKSAKFNASGGAPGSQATTDSDSSDDQSSSSSNNQASLVHAKHDLLVWFEILELCKYCVYWKCVSCCCNSKQLVAALPDVTAFSRVELHVKKPKTNALFSEQRRICPCHG